MAKIEKNAETVKDDVEAAAGEVAGDLRKGARQTADDMREAGREYVSRAREQVGHLYEEGQRRIRQVADHTEGRYDDLSDVVRRHPVQALGVAAGLGLIAGLILSRR